MISVIIPVYKKTDDFLKNLSHNLRFMKDHQVIVVNDDPVESIATKLKRFKVELIENKENLGFAGSVNTGVKMAKSDFIFLLNSDVLLLDNSFENVLEAFEKDASLFAVAFAQKEKDGSIIGKNKVFWDRGLIRHSKADDIEAGDTGWAEGGSSILRKKMFLELGGLDTLYAPFYWEDVDLSYRARKKGYKVLFDPNVLVEHHHESTIGTYWSRSSINAIAYRNQILCSWKHIEDTRIIPHLIHLHLFLIHSMLKGDVAFLRGYGKAFLLLFTKRFWKNS